MRLITRGKICRLSMALVAVLGGFLVVGLRAEAKEVGGAYITTRPAGAYVQLDNEDKGTSPALLTSLVPGEHFLKISMPGYETIGTNIEVAANELRDFKYVLRPELGEISVVTRPGDAKIFLDGKFVGRSPQRIQDLLVTKHWLEINRMGYQLWQRQVMPEKGKLKKFEIDLEETPPPPDHKKEKGDCQTECHDLTQSGARLQVASQPPGATVYVNGEAKGQTPATLYLYPGGYHLRIHKNDYIPQEKEVKLEFKQELVLNVPLEYDRSWKNMVYVPAGEFEMGSPWGAEDEQPVHKVYLDEFYIDKYEVTNKQYRYFVMETGHRQPSYKHERRWGSDDQPVIGVSWEDAEAYAKWAGKRLPTEAEWEKAAKGLKPQRYPWGDKWQLRSANTNETDKKNTVAVGSYPQGISPFGLYDVLGNVWEWCGDWYAAAYYKQSPKRNPQGPAEGKARVIRGGAWSDRGEQLLISSRKSLHPQVRLNNVGFRCVKDVPR